MTNPENKKKLERLQFKIGKDADKETVKAMLVKNIMDSIRGKTKETEAPKPVDGKCPDGWHYMDETDSCMKGSVHKPGEPEQ